MRERTRGRCRGAAKVGRRAIREYGRARRRTVHADAHAGGMEPPRAGAGRGGAAADRDRTHRRSAAAPALARSRAAAVGRAGARPVARDRGARRGAHAGGTWRRRDAGDGAASAGAAHARHRHGTGQALGLARPARAGRMRSPRRPAARGAGHHQRLPAGRARPVRLLPASLRGDETRHRRRDPLRLGAYGAVEQPARLRQPGAERLRHQRRGSGGAGGRGAQGAACAGARPCRGLPARHRRDARPHAQGGRGRLVARARLPRADGALADGARPPRRRLRGARSEAGGYRRPSGGHGDTARPAHVRHARRPALGDARALGAAAGSTRGERARVADPVLRLKRRRGSARSPSRSRRCRCRAYRAAW